MEGKIFVVIFFGLKSNLTKMTTLWRQNILMKWSMTLKVIEGLIRPLLCSNPSRTFIYEPILIKIYKC